MKKERIQPGYAILLILTVIFTLAALSTVIPSSEASKACMLGYKAHCSFTPWSTIICLIISAIICKLRAKFFVKKQEGK